MLGLETDAPIAVEDRRHGRAVSSPRLITDHGDLRNRAIGLSTPQCSLFSRLFNFPFMKGDGFARPVRPIHELHPSDEGVQYGTYLDRRLTGSRRAARDRHGPQKRCSRKWLTMHPGTELQTRTCLAGETLESYLRAVNVEAIHSGFTAFDIGGMVNSHPPPFASEYRPPDDTVVVLIGRNPTWDAASMSLRSSPQADDVVKLLDLQRNGPPIAR
jgi:hypothetical protein